MDSTNNRDSTRLSIAVKNIHKVFGDSPTDAIRRFESGLQALPSSRQSVISYLDQESLDSKVLEAALDLKQVASQVNVVIHAAGILTSLPYIIEDDENIVAVSLGAGNTGKKFDLETDRRVAEFKFIQWRGGPESIRQNNVFKDFLNLLWDDSGKKKQLFLTGTYQALAFFRGGRALTSVLSRNVKIKSMFEEHYGGRFVTVGEFYEVYGNDVEICDLTLLVPSLNNFSS